MSQGLSADALRDSAALYAAFTKGDTSAIEAIAHGQNHVPGLPEKMVDGTGLLLGLLNIAGAVTTMASLFSGMPVDFIIESVQSTHLLAAQQLDEGMEMGSPQFVQEGVRRIFAGQAPTPQDTEVPTGAVPDADLPPLVTTDEGSEL